MFAMLAGKIRKAHIPVIKNQLFKHICNSLLSFHAEHSVDLKLQQQLGTVRILFERGFAATCVKKLEKIKSLSLRQERFSIYQEAAAIQRKLLSKQHEFLLSIKEERKVLNKGLTVLQYTEYDRLLFEEQAKYRNRKAPRYRASIENLIKKIPPIASAVSSSFQTRHAYLRCRYWHAHAGIYDNHAELILEAAKDIMNLFEENPDYQLSFPREYVAAFSRYLVALSNFPAKEDPIVIFDRLTNFVEKENPMSSIRSKVKPTMDAIMFLTHYAIMHMNYDIALKRMEYIEQKIKQYEKQTADNILVSIRYNLVIIYFNLENFNMCLKWLNPILNYRKTNFLSDLFRSCQILNLIIHFELKNYELIEYKLKSVYKLFAVDRNLSLLETSLLNFIKTIIKPDMSKSLQFQFTAFDKEIRRILKNPQERKTLFEFDILSWIRSRIEKKSIIKVMRENKN